jgi:hypothetical protein
MIRVMIARLFVCFLALGIIGTATAQPAAAPASLAKVSGWAADAANVPVYSHDGTSLGRRDLRAEAVAGLREWNAEYDLIKVTRNPADDRWVPARHLALVFCERQAESTVAGAGRAENNRALSYGSGGKCGS